MREISRFLKSLKDRFKQSPKVQEFRTIIIDGTNITLPAGGKVDGVDISEHDHSSGQGASPIALAGVPNLPTTKITTGTFATARIPNLDASKITSGVFDQARIPWTSIPESGIVIGGDTRLKRLLGNALALDTGDRLIMPCNRPSGILYIDNLGSDVFHANDSEKVTTSSTYTLVKQTTLNYTPDSTLKIYFEGRSYEGLYCYFRIYRNDVAVGTERSTYSTGYVGWTETISGWNNGDKLQVYARVGNPGDTASVRNLRILGTIMKDVIESVF